MGGGPTSNLVQETIWQEYSSITITAERFNFLLNSVKVEISQI